MSDFSVLEQQPLPGGNVNKPASGTYGEGAALDRLQKALPQAQPPGPGAETGAPVAPLPRSAPAPSGGQPGVPGVIMGPTASPDVPAHTPLAMPAPNPVADAQSWRQRNLAVLDALVNNPTTSPETREWAQLLMQSLIGGSAQ